MLYRIRKCPYVFASEVVPPPQRHTAAILYSNPLGCPCTLFGDLHGAIQVLKNRGLKKNEFLVNIINKQERLNNPQIRFSIYLQQLYNLPTIVPIAICDDICSVSCPSASKTSNRGRFHEKKYGVPQIMQIKNAIKSGIFRRKPGAPQFLVEAQPMLNISHFLFFSGENRLPFPLYKARLL